MLTTLKIELSTEENINYHIGSLMHGLLMQLIDSAYAAELHNNSLNPYSQYIYKTSDTQYVWQISTLTSEAKEKILYKILENNNKIYEITSKNINLNVNNKIISPSITYEELADKFFTQEATKNKLSINFLTPTSFKTDGNYTIFPSISSIYPALYNKWNKYSATMSLEDEKTLEHLINYTKIVDYKLRSTRFCMEQVKINSFIGSIDVRINGPKTLANISNLLFEYSKYAGIGAKTSLGMGGIRIE